MSEIILSENRKHRIKQAFQAYWLSPFCTGTILLGEPLLSWALEARMLSTKGYADAYDPHSKVAYQIKTGLASSPLTFARLTTKSQFEFVNDPDLAKASLLGHELLEWVKHRVEEPKKLLGAIDVHVARLIYNTKGTFTYYERLSTIDIYDPTHYMWKWSSKGHALEGFRHNERWFSWYPQGREKSKNQNQLHFHGENYLIPDIGLPNRYDFELGEYGQIPFEKMLAALVPLFPTPPDE